MFAIPGRSTVTQSLQCLLEEIFRKTNRETQLWNKCRWQSLTNLRFADDVVLVSKNIKKVHVIGEELFKLSQETDLLANIQKTKFTNYSESNNLVIEGQVIERLEE